MGTLPDPSILVGISPSEPQAWGPRNTFLEHPWVMDYGGVWIPHSPCWASLGTRTHIQG